MRLEEGGLAVMAVEPHGNEGARCEMGVSYIRGYDTRYQLGSADRRKEHARKGEERMSE